MQSLFTHYIQYIFCVFPVQKMRISWWTANWSVHLLVTLLLPMSSLL